MAPRTSRDRTLAQVRTVARRANMDVNTMLTKLRDAGVKAADGGPVYATSKIEMTEAMRALQLHANEAPDLAKLAADAAEAGAKMLPPAPKAYTGDETSGPVPDFILEGAYGEVAFDFPPIPFPDPDKVYRPINVNADRQSTMVLRGWQFVTNPDHIRRIGAGSLERFVDHQGRIRYKDRQLAFLPLAVMEARRAARAKLMREQREGVEVSFQNNVEHTKRSLGRGADAKLSSFEMSEGEAAERAEHAAAKRSGVDRVVLDLGATTTTTK